MGEFDTVREKKMDQFVGDFEEDHDSEVSITGSKRIFDSGATRDSDDGKYDYEGFLSPLVIERFGEYMHANRKMKDDSLRDSDNWQKGIPKDAYVKSLWRHFMDLWKAHRGHVSLTSPKFLEEAICGIMFNAMGYLHEILKSEKNK